jgi:hypothetical protein
MVEPISATSAITASRLAISGGQKPVQYGLARAPQDATLAGKKAVGPQEAKTMGTSSVLSTTPGWGLSHLSHVPGIRIESEFSSTGHYQQTYGVTPLEFPTGPKGPTRPTGQLLFLIDEVGLGPSTARLTADIKRPLEFLAFDLNTQETVLRLERPYKVAGKAVRCFDAQGIMVGKVKRNMKLLHKHIDVMGPSGGVLYTMKAPRKPNWSKLPFYDMNKVKVGYLFKRLFPSPQPAFQPVAALKDPASGTSHQHCYYEVVFPTSADITARILIMVAAVFTDLVWFAPAEGKESKHA